jgi:hypothetical protein
MKRLMLLTLILAFSMGVAVYAANDRGGGGGSFKDSNAAGSRGGGGMARSGGTVRSQARFSQPVRIQMNHTSPSTGYHQAYQPSYGQVQRTRTAPVVQHTFQKAAPVQAVRQANTAHAPVVREAVAVRHHAYTQGYVRQKLSKIGVKTEPRYITDRSEIVSTDRAHSIIGAPRTGPKGEAFKGTMVSARQFNGSVVRNQMSAVNRPAYMQRIDQENRVETERDHYYWHTDGGFSYSHYIDHSGYHWYGWYAGDQFFWTRNYNGRWWWYDSGFNRWCFYNDNYWWWQDPYHVGELYVYNDDNYIPANSADDPVVVSGQEQAGETAYNSPDGKRSVKIVPGEGDAFLYDTADPSAFSPIYLASGVQSIQYSDVNNGRPLEIVLRLNDGSFDLFDAQGNPYNAATSQDD